ncbi:hypothetical protein [Mesorhizobium sp. ANAO-SY3R2]|uniref:hypothetical protein n=1 Tax=Mesorhizobium sp. ANAO-SY3R2 TaxID=3166644 RepID=UPI00366D38BC
MKVFSFLCQFFGLSSSDAVASCERLLSWIRDPLAHPEIERMDERQRGDLPFNTGFRRPPLDMRDIACRA